MLQENHISSIANVLKELVDANAVGAENKRTES
jgi:hypothetical protein